MIPIRDYTEGRWGDHGHSFKWRNAGDDCFTFVAECHCGTATVRTYMVAPFLRRMFGAYQERHYTKGQIERGDLA